jgi:tRNA(Ile)-lysidine synthase TilS/MesJ
MRYVYEFTNKRKLTKREFIKWFQKKFLYTIRKFKMAGKRDVIAYENKGDFRGAVLKNLLEMFSHRALIEIYKLPTKKKYTKKAITTTTDTEANKITQIIIKGRTNNLKELAPVYEKTIKPLFLFLDKEVLLYAKLMNLKFKKVKEDKNKISKFIDELEKKHPEIKNSIISSYLELF